MHGYGRFQVDDKLQGKKKKEARNKGLALAFFLKVALKQTWHLQLLISIIRTKVLILAIWGIFKFFYSLK